MKLIIRTALSRFALAATVLGTLLPWLQAPAASIVSLDLTFRPDGFTPPTAILHAGIGNGSGPAPVTGYTDVYNWNDVNIMSPHAFGPLQDSTASPTGITGFIHQGVPGTIASFSGPELGDTVPSGGPAGSNMMMSDNLMSSGVPVSLEIYGLTAPYPNGYRVILYFDQKSPAGTINGALFNITGSGSGTWTDSGNELIFGDFNDISGTNPNGLFFNANGGGTGNYFISSVFAPTNNNIRISGFTSLAGTSTALNGIQIVPVPEPTSVALLGLAGLITWRRRRAA
jgi:hypothetical protein